MPDEPENLVLRMLRAIDTKLDRIAGDVRDLKHRVGHLEEMVASLHVQVASLSVRIDRIDERVVRIEGRLDLRETITP